MPADYFTVDGATSVTSTAGIADPKNGTLDFVYVTVTAVFPATKFKTINKLLVGFGTLADNDGYPITGGRPSTLEQANGGVNPDAGYDITAIEWKPPVTDKFAANTPYEVTITLAAKADYTFEGVPANLFKVINATTTNPMGVDKGMVVTAVFPTTAGTAENPATIDQAAIEGVTIPVTGGTPVTTIDSAQYTGTIVWKKVVNNNPEDFTGNFAADSSYRAIITLTAKTGYTLTGVPENFFTVAGASMYFNSPNSGEVTAGFPWTAAAPTYGISINKEGSISLGTAAAGYTDFNLSPLEVTVNNEGNQATGNLTIALTGANANRFTSTPTSLNVPVSQARSFTIKPVTGLAAGTYNATVTVSGANITSKTFNVSFTVDAAGPYVITGSGSEFTATRSGTIGTGSIQDVIDAIRTDAAGKPVIIQFGDGSTVLNTDLMGIEFSGTWGAVTLTGKITSGITTIAIRDAVSITSSADIAGTNSGLATINKSSTGTLTISGGTISATNASAILTSNSVNGSGPVYISGGTVSATGGRAIFHGSSSLLTVSGTALITSANVADGTILLSGNTVFTQLEIAGGTVQNTASSVNAYAIDSHSLGNIIISGGSVISDTGVAIRNVHESNTENKLDIKGGLVSTATGTAVYNNSRTWVRIYEGSTVKATTGVAVLNNSVSLVSIYGGTISATTGTAIRNTSTGGIDVYGTENPLITSANPNPNEGTIYLAAHQNTSSNDFQVRGGEIKNTSTATNSNAVYNASSDTIKIYGGTISATTGTALYNASTGVVNNGDTQSYINGGTIQATTGTAIRNASTGAINIYNGTVSATTGYAIYNTGTGKITVAQNGTVTSAKPNGSTINLGQPSTDNTNIRLEIKGGIVSNTNTTGSSTATTLYNNSTGSINISGGTVSLSGVRGQTINNESTGALNISGGTVTSSGLLATTILNFSTGTVTISNGTVSASDAPGAIFRAILNYGGSSKLIIAPSAVIIGDIENA